MALQPATRDHRRVALHEDELEIDRGLVRRLVARWLPQYAGLEVVALRSTGSSNALFRLGEGLLVRLPRQPGGTATIEKEARWLPLVAPALSVRVPEVVAVGGPGFGYPERWSVTRWLEGEVPRIPRREHGGAHAQGLATDLARVVSELRALEVPPAAAADPALSWYRGGPLADLDDDFRASVEECRTIAGLGLDLGRAQAAWEEALAAERTSTPRTAWFHGDLLAENLLLRDGALAAVLDFGGLAVGDPAVDLVVAWEVLDAPARQAFRRAIGATGVDGAEWARGKGWALLIAMITFPYYWRTMPERCAARREMAAAVLADGAGG